MWNRVSVGRKEIRCQRRNVITKAIELSMEEREVPNRRDALTQQRFHLPYSLVETHQNRPGHDAVADVVLDDF
jgi:hypothetical protein